MHVRGDYSRSKFKTVKFCYVEVYTRNVNIGHEKQQFRYFLKKKFNQTSTQIISKWQIITLFQKRANRPTQINSQILKPFICDFFGGQALQLRSRCYKCAPSTWFTLTNTCPTKNSNGRCLRYLAYECRANFPIN